MKTQFVGAFLAVWANLALTQAFYSPKDDVLNLTPQNFGPAILDTDVKELTFSFLSSITNTRFTIALSCRRVLCTMVWSLSKTSSRMEKGCNQLEGPCFYGCC